MAFTRKFLTEHGVPEDQVDAIMAERNRTLQDYIPKADVQAQIDEAVKSDDAAELAVAAEAAKALYEKLDPDGSKFIADRTEVMGYDMTDTSLTKAEKKKIRKCFSYEVYKNTEQLATQLVVWTSIFSIFTIFAEVCVLMGMGLLAV